MTVTYQNAQDELFGIVKAVIALNDTPVVGYEMDVRWPGVALANRPDQDKLWARVSSQVVSDSQVSLGNDGGIKMYEAIGLLYVQLFAPRNTANSKIIATALAELIRAEFRKASPSGNIWFTQQKIVDLPETDSSYPMNVVVEFRYKTTQ